MPSLRIRKVAGKHKVITIYMLMLYLGIRVNLTNCICEPPSQCNKCKYFDVHQDRNLFSAMCDNYNLTSIPLMLPRDELGRLSVAFNNITTISADVMATYSNLKELSLNANQLSSITNGSFKYNKILEKLYISANRIEMLHEKNFEGLSLLTRLILECNQIQHLRAGTFRFLVNLAELSLRDNKISAIDVGAFEGLSQLRSLVLGGNRLMDIEFTLGTQPFLTFVDFSFNRISAIAGETFSGVPRLRRLHINDNNLRRFPDSALKYVRNLTELDLSTNPITFIPSDSFMGLDALETLYLSSANISIIHEDSFESLKSLNELYINGNPLNCDCHMAWLRKWLARKLIQTNTNIKRSASERISTNNKASDSKFELHYPSETVCQYPARAQGKQLLKLNASDFLCSCQTCLQDISCYGTAVPVCNCSDNWIREACDPSCKLREVGLRKCTSHNGTCYCSEGSKVCGKNAVLTTTNETRTCQCKREHRGDAFTECIGDMPSNENEWSTSNMAFLITGLTAAVCLIVLCLGWYKMRLHRKRSSSSSLGVNWANAIPFTSWANRSSTTTQLQPSSTSTSLSSHMDLPGNTAIWDEWELSRDLLRLGQKIGEGEFGLVLKGFLLTDGDEKEVAIKTLKEEDTQSVHVLKDMMAELKIFKKVGQHPNVVSLVGACTSPGGPLYIVTEFVGGGNLLNYLRANRRGQIPEYINVAPPVNENDLVRIALDVAKGMKHIIEKALVHRDLAARNVLLTEDGKAKVTDFGLSRCVYTEGVYLKTSHGRLPLKWMAPESLEQFVFTSKSDVWSYGILLWEMVTFGGFPYSDIPAGLLLACVSAGYRLQKPFYCSDKLYNVMLLCWKDEPYLRPSFDDLCNILEELLSESTSAYVNLDMTEISRFLEYEMPGETIQSSPVFEDTRL